MPLYLIGYDLISFGWYMVVLAGVAALYELGGRWWKRRQRKLVQT
ncbi:hypothetical protein [Candidatus Poriferisodalis sp.]